MSVQTTPLMQQYWAIKNDYADALVFFQVGDFYELFFEDAKNASAFLGITLTKRGKEKGEDIPLCGVPVHTVDHYLAKLVKGGFSVVICEQLEVATPGKMVKRGVTKVLTPGTLTESNLLRDKSASYILSCVLHEDRWGLLFAELMTAQLYATTVTAGGFKELETELSRFFPDEVILSDDLSAKTFQSLFKKQGYYTSACAPDDTMLEWAKGQLQEAVVDQIKANKAIERALGTLCAYFKKNNSAALHEFNQLHFYEPDDFVMLDAASQKNLELVSNNQDGSTVHTLLACLDKATTAMGSRMLKKWLVRPLIAQPVIEQRLDTVMYLKNNNRYLEHVTALLKTIGDCERVVGRIALERARFEDYVHLMQALKVIPEFVASHDVPYFVQMVGKHTQEFNELHGLLMASLNDDRTKEWIIKKGFDQRLDRLRGLVTDSHHALLALEKKEQEATGINSLKIRYTNVHGYYIEITNTHLDAVPERYKRQQTLVGRERFMCSELQELQHEITTAGREIEVVEKEIFKAIQHQVRPYVGGLRKMTHLLAQLDALAAFARCAYERGYTRPEFHGTRDICITQGYHPVVAQQVGSQFIPNDTFLTDQESLWIITGPNMGGKSTYLRQTALICLMAQCGSFVPAARAQLPLLDAVFTRIGASDNVAEGKSTFLVEMEETAHICQYATSRSLVILDEVGRGTSTFDGLAIAQAVIEHLHTKTQVRCLFATHYHELTALVDELPGVANYHVASKKNEQGIVFLHTMIKGVAHGSFGLAVAHLAHLPPSVINRAYHIMQNLSLAEKTVMPHADADFEKEQLQAAVKKSEVLKQLLQAIDYENLSPKKAFDILWQVKDQLH